MGASITKMADVTGRIQEIIGDPKSTKEQMLGIINMLLGRSLDTESELAKLQEELTKLRERELALEREIAALRASDTSESELSVPGDYDIIDSAEVDDADVVPCAPVTPDDSEEKCDKSKCKRCQKTYKIETLNKHDGICGYCHAKCVKCGKRCKKLLGTGDARVCQACKKGKTPCPNCKKTFTQKTLDQYGGICRKCKKPGRSTVQTSERKALNIAVWDKYVGPTLRIGPCYVCAKPIKMEEIHLGHIISAADGGKREIDNLRPVCPLCNTSCGAQNLDTFRAAFISKK